MLPMRSSSKHVEFAKTTSPSLQSTSSIELHWTSIFFEVRASSTSEANTSNLLQMIWAAPFKFSSTSMPLQTSKSWSSLAMTNARPLPDPRS